MTTIIIFISLGVGIAIGALNLIPTKYLKYNDLFTFIGVLLLLFIMGISLGIKIDIKDLKSLGYQSLVFTLLTVIFSILVVYVLTKIVLKEQDQQ